MSARRSELTRQAARLFAEKGYHGTSVGDLAEALGVQKGSLYAHIESKLDLLWEVAREGAEAFHTALDTVPEDGPVVERIRKALRAHLGVVGDRVQRGVEGGRTVHQRVEEQVLLRGDVRVERALLDAERLGEVADRGAVVALLGEEAGGLARQLRAACGHATVGRLTIVR